MKPVSGDLVTTAYLAVVVRPVPATRYTGEPGVADVCLAYRRELLIARPTTRACPRADAS